MPRQWFGKSSQRSPPHDQVNLCLNLGRNVAALFVLVTGHQEETSAFGGFLPYLVRATLLLTVPVRVDDSACMMFFHIK